jgi:hypothetical protein
LVTGAPVRYPKRRRPRIDRYEAGANSKTIKVLLTFSPSRATYLVAAIVNRDVGHLAGERMGEKDCHVFV